MGRLFGKKEKSIMSFINFSGVFGVYEGTNIIESGAYGFADKNFRIKNNTSFSYGTASGTKGFTTVSILTLAAENKLNLDDSIKKLLNTKAENYGSLDWLSEKVTVRNLLNHTSGVPDYFDEDYVDDFEEALCRNANYHYEKPADFFPLIENMWKKQQAPYSSTGTFKYSNGGFVLLAAVAEAVSGMSFPSFVKQHVFTKLNMKSTGFFRLDETPPDGIVCATGYQQNGRSNIYEIPVIGGGDGGSFTTLADMAQFWHNLDPELNPKSTISSFVEKAWSPCIEGDDGLYGLGFWMRKENPHIVFLEGFDPGVQFFSFYNRVTKRSLTICLNDEQSNCMEVFEKYFKLIQ